MGSPEDLLDHAEKIVRILNANSVPSVVIGAVAMAAHHYVRYTRDLDLGISVEIRTLHKLTSSLRLAGFSAELTEPDGEDPLGGVIDITDSFGLVQIINFGTRFPAVIEDALRGQLLPLRPESPLKLAPLPQLVALKLYAGGFKSKADLLELLKRNPDADIPEIRKTCRRYRLSGLDDILSELEL